MTTDNRTNDDNERCHPGGPLHSWAPEGEHWKCVRCEERSHNDE